MPRPQVWHELIAKAANLPAVQAKQAMLPKGTCPAGQMLHSVMPALSWYDRAAVHTEVGGAGGGVSVHACTKAGRGFLKCQENQRPSPTYARRGPRVGLILSFVAVYRSDGVWGERGEWREVRDEDEVQRERRPFVVLRTHLCRPLPSCWAYLGICLGTI